MFNKNLSAKNEKAGLIVYVQEIIMKISNTFDNYWQKNFISKPQAKYTTKLKRNSSPTQTLIVLDFAETYSSLCQDAVQSFHWNFALVILHLFIYFTVGVPNLSLNMYP